jgi:ABC-2 type transport system ATP-binding protein
VSEAAVLVAEGLHKHWPRRPEPVLTGATFTLRAGESAWLTGANGAGKTTLARVVCGLIRPGDGSVRLGALDPERTRSAYQRRIGFLPAGDRGLYARLSVRRHLQLWARVAFVPAGRRAEAIAAVVDRFRLDELLDWRVDRLSMGQRQRVRVAMTFLHDPDVLLLDEPLTSLDEAGGDLLRAAIAEHVATDGMCLWISPGNDHPDVDFTHRWRLAEGRITER